MKSIILFSALLVLSLFSLQSHAQYFGWSTSLGYAKPQGNGFVDGNGIELKSGGLNYEFDGYLCPKSLDSKLGFGIEFMGNLLVSNNNGTFSAYGMDLYALKMHYRFKEPETKVSPYFSLAVGVAKFSSPEFTSGGTVIVPADEAYALGIRPHIGLELARIQLDVAYLIPMEYDINGLSSLKGTAGSLTFSIGYRHYFGS